MPLDSIPWCQSAVPQQVLDHPTIGETRRVSQKAFRDFSLAPLPSPLTPVVGDPAFTPGLQDPKFLDLKRRERTQAQHFVVNGQWMTRQQIMADADLAELSFWQKIQLAHFLGSLPPTGPFERQLTSFELLCTDQSLLSHAVSLTYQLLISPPEGHKLSFIASWEKELGIELSERQVDRLFLFSYKTSICARNQEAGFKVLTRWYHTPAKIHKMFPQCSNLCWRCGEEVGSMLHVF